MKKRIEAELISIAHRILKLKNKSEINQLYAETQKLYEALSVLKFYEDNFEMLKESMSREALEEKVEVVLNEPITEEKEEPKVVVGEIVLEDNEVDSMEDEVMEDEAITADETEIEEEITDDNEVDDDIEDEEDNEDEEESNIVEVDFKPAFELSFDSENTEEAIEVIDLRDKGKQFTLEDILGDSFEEPVFVKPEENKPKEQPVEKNEEVKVKAEKKKEITDAPKNLSINDTYSKTISFGLNDKIGFVNHLFNGSNEDFNRVLSQLNTFDTFEDAKEFLNEMVIPEYNYWVGKEEYLERFLEIIQNKFK